MAEPPAYQPEPGTPTHRSRPSIITNASAFADSTMSYGSIMSGDGLARLSQFPSPPSSVPFGSFEGLSPVKSDYAMDPSTATRRALPTPPSLPPAPLNIQKRPTGVSFPNALPSSPSLRQPVDSRLNNTATPSLSRAPTLTTASLSRAPTLTTASTISSYPSPHDWHDGSSSIAADPYGEAVLSTSFITSLLSSVAERDVISGSPTAFTQPKRYYEPSMASQAFTIDSAVTYPPPNTFPPPMPSSQSNPQLWNTQNTSSVTPSHLQPLRAPVHSYRPMGGRATPETTTTYDSGDRTVQTADMAQPGPSTEQMSIVASLQSLNSTTPLIQSFPRGDPILEEDERLSGPSTPGTRHSRTRSRRVSVAYSSKTTKSYVSSFVTRIPHPTGTELKSLRQATVSWFRGKPLPPVPPVPGIPFRDIQRQEAALPLPELVNRAQALSRLLDSGHHPHHSTISLEHAHGNAHPPPGPVSGFGDRVRYTGANPNMSNYAYGRKGRSEEYSHNAWSLTEPPATPESPLKSRKFSLSRLSKRQKLWGGITLLLVIIGAITGIAVGVTVGKDKASHVVCEGNSTGAACNLDATCVCTSTVTGQCGQLAQTLLDLVPNLNSLFNANFTPATLSTAVWEAQGAPSSSNCAQQAILVDVAPALDSVASPNRTLWAQSALLWNLAESVDLNGTAHLQQFVLDADWHTLLPTDGPTTTSASQFSTTISGYEFNFAAQTVVAPPATFETEGQPSQAQIDQVDDSTKTALDRMYTYASASSTQQKQALSQYWTGVLQQKSSDLNTFVSTIRGAPILLPFDATNESLANLLTNPSTSPFPPPLACYPGLSSDQLQKINSIETSIFGLPPAQAQTTFDTSCFASRPIYGTLNILQLRLPFLDGRQGAAKQAAVLEPDAYSRAIIYSGEVLSAMPGSSSPNPPVSDPRQYGTLNNLDHVLLQYLKSISDVNDAIALVEFVLGQTPPIVPPGDTTLLYTALSSLPSLEIAILGSVGPSDISSTVSSFSDLSGKLFFGSTDSLDLRTWTINTNQAPHTVAWAELATSPEVVRDDSLTDDTFNTIWNSSFTFFHTNNTANVQVSNITTGFQALGLFNP